MASTYSTNLAIELIGTGDQAGSWGNTTNTNLGTLIEQAISGYVTQAVSTGTDTTITIPNGATGVARNMYIELTGTGGTNTNLIVPANKKLYFIFNNTTGAVTVKVSGQTGVSVPQGKKVVLTSNGTDIVNGLNYIADFGSNSATITQLTATSATITNLTLTSLVISNLSIASANITTLTSSSATITNLLGTTLTVSGNSFLATSSGNVGVGTASPAYKLDVSGSLRTTSFWALTGSPTGAGGSVRYIGGGGSSTNWYTNVPTGGSQFWAINESPVMALDSSGNLGIGTSSPQDKLSALSTQGVNTFANPVMSYGANFNWPAGFANIYDASYVDQFMLLNARMTGGTRAAPTFTGAANGGISLKVDGLAGGLAIQTIPSGAGASATTRAYFDTSGNLGLGVTPSAGGATANYKLFEIGSGGGGSIYAGPGQTLLCTNVAWSGGTAQYKASSINAMQYSQETGMHIWKTAGTGTAGNTISFTQAMTLDASGNLGIGTTSPASRLNISTGEVTLVTYTSSRASGSYNTYNLGTSGTTLGYIGHAPQLVVGTSNNEFAIRAESALIFAAGGNTERARITAAGDLLIGTTSNADSRRLRVYGISEFDGNGVGLTIYKSSGTKIGSSGQGNYVVSGGPSDGFGIQSETALVFGSGGTTERARIDTNGNVLVGMTTRPISISNAIGYKSAANGVAGSVSMSGSTWVDLVTLPTPTLGGARVNILGNENSNVNTYYGTWTMLYSSTGWTIAGPYNEMQAGNDYGVPNLRISAGKIQVQARNGVSSGVIQYNIEYYAVA